MSLPRSADQGLRHLSGLPPLRLSHALHQGRCAAVFRPVDRFPLRRRDHAGPL